MIIYDAEEAVSKETEEESVTACKLKLVSDAVRPPMKPASSMTGEASMAEYARVRRRGRWC
jgi:hypothetical protein